MKKETYVRICPICKSTDIYWDTSNPAQPAVGLSAMYACKKCGHLGRIFPEIPVNKIQALKKETSTVKDVSPKVDVSYGIFEGRVWFVILGPLHFLAGIYSWFVVENRMQSIIFFILGSILCYFAFFKKWPKHL